MSPAESLERILKEIQEKSDVSNVTLVSRDGKHIAGDVPKKAHNETYIAMSAILLGSAETATSEVDEKLNYVLVELDDSRILIQDSNTFAILVTRLRKDACLEDVLEITDKYIDEIKESL